MVKRINVSVEDTQSKAGEVTKPKVDKLKELKAEANRLVSLANKRVRRLEKNNLQSAPAYRAYIATGGKPFSTKGKDYNQLQSELSRLRRFIDSETSTVKGVNSYLKEMAKNTGIKYKNLKELRAKADNFFELASKVEQYLRQVEDIASAIGYQKIWESINVYVKDNKLDLSESTLSLEQMTETIGKAIAEYETGIIENGVFLGNSRDEDGEDWATLEQDDIWFFLDKE